MVTSSNNAESTSGSIDANQEPGGSFGKKNNPALQPGPKSAYPVDEDEHYIHKCDKLFGGKV